AAKINLARVVGPLRADGKHEVAIVYQRVSLADRVALEPSASLRVDGFADDTLVRQALESIAAEAGVAPAWRVRLTKRIPVAAGGGGGRPGARKAVAAPRAHGCPRRPGRGGELPRRSVPMCPSSSRADHSSGSPTAPT